MIGMEALTLNQVFAGRYRSIPDMSDRRIPKPSFAELFTPKLITIMREGYGFRDLQADAVSGLTVAIVALPLSMAIAIACS